METITGIYGTTVGRVLLFNIVPKGLPFDLVNQNMAKKQISRIINVCYRNVGLKETVIFADQLMYTGYKYSTVSGSSIGVNDFEIPAGKAQIISDAKRRSRGDREPVRLRAGNPGREVQQGR